MIWWRLICKMKLQRNWGYLFAFQSRRKRARTPTPGHYLGLKSTRDFGKLYICIWFVNVNLLLSLSVWSIKIDLLIHFNSIIALATGHRGDRGRYRGRDDYRRSPRRSPFRGGRDYSPRHSPHGGRSRRDRSRSLPYSPSPERRYVRGSRWYFLVFGTLGGGKTLEVWEPSSGNVMLLVCTGAKQIFKFR